MRILVLGWVLAAGVMLHSQAALDQRPLPDTDAFYEAVRQNMVRADREQNRYAYKERRTDIHTNPFGRIGTGGTRVIEVIPAADGLTASRRVIERDNVPVSDSPAEKITLSQRRGQNSSRNVEDITQTLTFAIARREMVDGRPFIVIDFEPRPGAKPSTRQGRLARAFKGSMWVNEDAHEIERVEATAVQDLSFGLGLVARLRKGATVSAERKPVEGGLWMPTSVRLNGAGRAILFRKLDIDYALDWFDYRLVVPAR
ncbi:MAG: hypothetical protein ABL986_02425 [Vicinamibacterales bacterium]